VTGFGATLPLEPFPKADPNLPYVVVSPRHNFGRPMVDGVPIEVLVGAVAAGEDPTAVAEEYDTTRAGVLVAVWFEAKYGGRARRRTFREWAEQVEGALWAAKTLADHDAIPDPHIAGTVAPST
jgi:uncharacterized protein (DUF433 family)